MKNYKEKIKLDGGWKKAIDFIKGLFTANVPGYRFYTTKGTHLTKEEILELRKVPMLLPDFIAQIIGSHLIGRQVRMFRTHNVILTLTASLIAAALNNELVATTDMAINYQELGTGTTAPDAGDTGLETPSAGTRKAVSSIARSNNVLVITSFWDVGEATGTWKEFVLFINGTATSNSGTPLNRIGIDVTVASGDALTLDGELEVN